MVFGFLHCHPDSLGCSTITLPWCGTFLFFLSLPRITQAQLYCPESLRPSSLYALVLYLFDPSIHSSSSTSSRYPSQFKFPRCVGFHISSCCASCVTLLTRLIASHDRCFLLSRSHYLLRLLRLDCSLMEALSTLLHGSLVEDVDTQNVVPIDPLVVDPITKICC